MTAVPSTDPPGTWSRVGVFVDEECSENEMCFAPIEQHASVPGRLLVRSASADSPKPVVLKKGTRANAAGEDAALAPGRHEALGRPKIVEYRRASWITAIRHTPGAAADVFIAVAAFVAAVWALLETLRADDGNGSRAALGVALVVFVAAAVKAYRDVRDIA